MKKRHLTKGLFFGIMSTTLLFNGCGMASTNNTEAGTINNTSIESDTTNNTEEQNSTTNDTAASVEVQAESTTPSLEGDDSFAYANFDFYEKVLTAFVNGDEDSFCITDGAGASDYSYYEEVGTSAENYCCFSLIDLNQDGILELVVGENDFYDFGTLSYPTAIFKSEQGEPVFYNISGFDKAAGVFDQIEPLSMFREETVGRFEGSNLIVIEELNYEDYDPDNECPMNPYHVKSDGSTESLTAEELENYKFDYNFERMEATYFITPENIQKIFVEKDFAGADGPQKSGN